MQLKNKIVLVTGGAGFIGSSLVEFLLREGCFVKVLDNFSNGKKENTSNHKNNNNFELIEGSITDNSNIEKALKDVEIVFNLACLGVRHSIKYPMENHRVNAEGTLRLLECSYHNKVEKFIHCSSSEVYGPALSIPMNENHPTFPCTVYGGSKLAGEAYCRAYYRTYGLNTIVIRPFNAYGPRSHHEGDAGEMIPKSIVRVLSQEPILIFGDGLQSRDFTYVDDIAEAFILAAKTENLEGGTYNLGNCFEISIKSLAEKIIQLIDNGMTTIQHTRARPGDVERLFGDATKFSQITGWTPKVDFIQGLKKTISWFQNQPNLDLLKQQEVSINW